MWWEWLIVGVSVSAAGAYLARVGAAAVRQLTAGRCGSCGGRQESARACAPAVLVQLNVERRA